MSSEQWLKTIDFIQDAYEAGNSSSLAAGLGKLAVMVAAGTMTEAYLRTAMPMIRLGYAISGRSDQWLKWKAFSGWAAGEVTGVLIDQVNDWSIGSHAYDTKEFISAALRNNPDPMTKITRFIPWSDPLVLDLDGDGFETTPLAKTPPVMFDGDADAIKNATAWIGSDDGLLVLDRNANGNIDNGGELFGDATILTTGPDIGKKAAHGFAALADLDSNLDGVFNASDAQFGAVRIWRDFNQDGLSQADELKTLIESGVASITLSSTASATSYGDGLLVRDGTFTRTDGSSAQAGSFVLGQNTAIREFAPITLSPEAATLPAIGGAGWARNLQEAATQSPALVGVVHQAQAAMTKADFRQAVADMLWTWGSESAYVSASDEALAEGCGLILSEPQDAQEVGWMDMAVKASTAERNAFRAGLGGDLAKFDAMRERMAGDWTIGTNCQNIFTPTCGRARRASVPTGLRARGRGACGESCNSRQRYGRRIASVAAANWLRPTGTATRHACGGGWHTAEQYRVRKAACMRLASRKWLDGRIHGGYVRLKQARLSLTQRCIAESKSSSTRKHLDAAVVRLGLHCAHRSEGRSVLIQPNHFLYQFEWISS